MSCDLGSGAGHRVAALRAQPGRAGGRLPGARGPHPVVVAGQGRQRPQARPALAPGQRQLAVVGRGLRHLPLRRPALRPAGRGVGVDRPARTSPTRWLRIRWRWPSTWTPPPSWPPRCWCAACPSGDRARRPRRRPARRWGPGQTLAELREGWQYIFINPTVRAVNIGLATGLVGGGMLIPLGAVYSADVLHAGAAGYGLFTTALGFGVAIGRGRGGRLPAPPAQGAGVHRLPAGGRRGPAGRGQRRFAGGGRAAGGRDGCGRGSGLRGGVRAVAGGGHRRAAGSGVQLAQHPGAPVRAGVDDRGAACWPRCWADCRIGGWVAR